MGPLVHRDLTARLALIAGLSEAEAREVGLANLAVDERWPGRNGPLQMSRHLAPWAWWWARRFRREALATGSLEMLGWSLHSTQDAITHGPLGLAHLLNLVGILRRNPDDWDAAPPRIREAIELRTTRDLDRFVRERTWHAGCSETEDAGV
jgi:hypothetical protein